MRYRSVPVSYPCGACSTEVVTYETINLDTAKTCVTGIGKVKNTEGEYLGYFVEVTPQGFKDVISMIVGVDLGGNIKDVVCLSSSETAGIGTKATSDSHLDKYDGLNASSVDTVDAITGATISSKAIKHGISDACETIKSIMEVE